MGDQSDAVETGMSVIGGCLVVSVQSDLQTATLMRMQKDILSRIQATTVRSTILDLSTVAVLDSQAFRILADTARMCLLLGVQTMFVEFQPAVVSALVDLDVDTAGISTARTLEDGLRLLQAKPVGDADSDADGGEQSEQEENQCLQPCSADSDAEESEPDAGLA